MGVILVAGDKVTGDEESVVGNRKSYSSYQSSIAVGMYISCCYFFEVKKVTKNIIEKTICNDFKNDLYQNARVLSLQIFRSLLAMLTSFLTL